MATRMIQRRGTAAEWTSANPVLAAGEIGFETDTTKFKFGDGTTTWDSLKYYTSIDDIVDGAPDLLNTLNELAAAIGDDSDFITTIQSDLDSKLNLTGGTVSGNLIVQSDFSVGGNLNLSNEPINPGNATTKNYVDGLVTPVALDVATLQGSVAGAEANISTLISDVAANASDISEVSSEVSELRRTFIKMTAPTSSDNDNNPIESGALWYETSTGNLYIYVDLDGTNYVWAETGSPAVLDGEPVSSVIDFPVSPADGDTHNFYVYDQSKTAWVVDRSTTIADNTDVEIVSTADNDVLMYNSSTGKFENKRGIPLDANGDIPIAFLDTLRDSLINGSGFTSLSALESFIATEISDLNTDLLGGASLYLSLNDIEQYLASGLFNDVPALTVKSALDWSSDTSVPLNGSLNLETGGSEIKIKIGNGSDFYADLDYVPTNGSVATSISTAIAPLAPKADPTFSGTVSLPSTTSIGDVSDAEIAHLDGVTSGIQGQLDSLDTLKAPIADPTFTGTVSGVTKTMVGLSNVDNTADTDKPVSTATQTALDLKADLSGAVFTGNVQVDGNFVVDGNLTVNGTEFLASATSITIEDNIVRLAHTNPANTVDLGLVVAYNDGAPKHSGLVRDVSENTWKLFDGVVTEPSTTVEFAEGGLDNLSVNNVNVSGVVFADGTQTQAGVPSLTTFVEKTASYQLDTLDHKDNVVEMNMSSAGTFTVPLDATLAWPVGASMDIFATGTGEITIAGEAGVTLNATPGLTLRTQWSSATIMKRGADNWVVYGDLKA